MRRRLVLFLAVIALAFSAWIVTIQDAAADGEPGVYAAAADQAALDSGAIVSVQAVPIWPLATVVTLTLAIALVILLTWTRLMTVLASIGRTLLATLIRRNDTRKKQALESASRAIEQRCARYFEIRTDRHITAAILGGDSGI